MLVTGSNSVWANNGNLSIGYYGRRNSLIISNGGRVVNSTGYIGNDSTAHGNTVLVTGAGSVWSNRSELYVGYIGAGNSLSVSDGGWVADSEARIGSTTSSSNNTVWVTGDGSVWTNGFAVYVGLLGAGNSLIISNGAKVFDAYGSIGLYASASNNTVSVTGDGSLWRTTADLYLGTDGAQNTLNILSGGAVLANNLSVGVNSSSTGNLLNVTGGNLTVTNSTGSSLLEVRRGTLSFNGGTIRADRLLATNGANSVVVFNAGTLSTLSATISNGQPFTVGNGTDAAVLQLRGGTNRFEGGLTIAGNATLSGNGTISSPVTIANGGQLSPGLSVGTQSVAQLTLQPNAQLLFELGAPSGTNDFVFVAGDLTLDGTLNVVGLPGFANGTYVLMRYDGVLTDNGLEVGAMPSGYNGTIYLADANYVKLVVVPEPSAFMLVAVGLCVVMALQKRFTRPQ